MVVVWNSWEFRAWWCGGFGDAFQKEVARSRFLEWDPVEANLAKNGWGGLLGFQTREGHGEDGERDLAADLFENWGEERRIVNMARIQEIGGDWVETRREEGDGKKSCHGRLVTHLFETFGKEGRIVATIQE